MALPHGVGAHAREITAEELAARLKAGASPRMIDVREPDEFAAAHIPGAENLPLSRLAERYRTLPRDEELILVCRSGNRSGMAQQFLEAQGYRNTRNLIDGMLGWHGPVTRGS